MTYTADVDWRAETRPHAAGTVRVAVAAAHPGEAAAKAADAARAEAAKVAGCGAWLVRVTRVQVRSR